MKSLIVAVSCLPLFVYGMGTANSEANNPTNNPMISEIPQNSDNSISKKISPADFGKEDQADQKEVLDQLKVTCEILKDSAIPSSIKLKIQQNLIKILFFRPDLIPYLRSFLPNQISLNDFPRPYRTSQFSEFLNSVKPSKNVPVFRASDESNSKLHEIIEQDDLESLQKEIKGDLNDIKLKVPFFEIGELRVRLLHYCIMCGATKCFKFLILNGADPSVPTSSDGSSSSSNEYLKWTAMPFAIALGKWEYMKILEERGINEIEDPNVWEAAALTHRNGILKTFIGNKDSLNNYSQCVAKSLEGAAKGNNLKGVKLLLKELHTLNQQDPNFLTSSLCFASKFDNEAIVKILISAGADVNATNKYGVTPLYLAAENDSSKMGELLISKGADVNAQGNIFKLAPIHGAAVHDSVRMGRLLLSKNASFNVRDRAGQSPLHVAAMFDSNKIGEILISKGADINAKDNDGKTPLQYAEKGSKMKQLLVSKGAQW